MEDVPVYFHRDNTMDTLFNDTVIPAGNLLNDGDDIEFVLNPALKGDLRVKAVNFASKNGLEVWLDTNNNIPFSSTSIVTVNIFDDSAVIATESFSILNGESMSIFRVPFIESANQYYTFSKGSEISVNLSVADAPVRITYEDSSTNGFLLLHCNPVSKITVAAHHSDGSLGEFYPNMPYDQQRFIQFRGTVTDAFGPYNAHNVTLELKGVFGPQEAIYTFAPDDNVGQFTYDYTYPSGLQDDDYEMVATVTLNNQKSYLKSNFLTMAQYGTYLECAEPNGEGVHNEVVKFDIDVYNVGGDDDIIDLTATPDLAGWVATVAGGSKTGTIRPGEFDTKILDVTVSATAAKNEECIVSITGRSSNPKAFTLDPPISVIAIPEADFDFDPPVDLQKQIPTGGGSVEYEFTLRNIGQDEDTYTITGTNPTQSGWSVEFSSVPSSAEKISDTEYRIDLESYKDVSFTYEVTSQANPSVKKVELDVQATGLNASASIKHKTITTIETEPGILTLTAQNDVVKKQANLGVTIDQNDTTNVGFSLRAENKDQIETFSVDLTIIDLPSGWDYALSPDSFDLDPERSRTITLSVTIPEITHANPDNGYKFTVRASYGSKVATLDLSVTIPKVYNIQLATAETEKSVEAGKEVNYEITMINKGNVEGEEVDVSVTELTGWDITVSRPSITLGEYNSIIRVTVSVTPSTSVPDDEDGVVEVQVKVDGSVISNKLTLKTSVKKDVNTELMDFLYDYWFIPVLVVIIFILTFIIRSRLK
jgi:uncharacterized membrane protein